MGTRPEPTVIPVQVIDGEQWWVCPAGGAECCRVIGEWAADAIAWHVANHHRTWR